MEREVHRSFRNVGPSVIQDFLVGCEDWEKKRIHKRKGLVVKPIVHTHMNSRGQVDLIDFQTQPNDEFEYIFSYQDHLTKRVSLRPLRKNTAEEVALELLDVFIWSPLYSTEWQWKKIS